jgi:alpha-tubulin suppressor-like RCC1 family protein
MATNNFNFDISALDSSTFNGNTVNVFKVNGRQLWYKHTEKNSYKNQGYEPGQESDYIGPDYGIFNDKDYSIHQPDPGFKYIYDQEGYRYAIRSIHDATFYISQLITVDGITKAIQSMDGSYICFNDNDCIDLNNLGNTFVQVSATGIDRDGDGIDSSVDLNDNDNTIGRFAFLTINTDSSEGTETQNGEDISYKGYLPGTQITLQATAGYQRVFDRWITNDLNLTESEAKSTSITFSMPQHHVSITPSYNFIDSGQANYGVKFLNQNPDAGITQDTGFGIYSEKQEVIIIAEPKAGYKFEGWQSGDVNIFENNDQSLVDSIGQTNIASIGVFTMPQKSVEIEGVFTALQYSVNVIDSIEGSASGGGLKDYQSLVSLSPNPSDSKYTFVSWEVEGISLSAAQTSDPDLTFVMPPNDVSIKPIFQSNEYSVVISYSKTDNGIGYIGNDKLILSGTFMAGDTFAVTAESADPSYNFNGWTSTEINILSQDEALSLTMPDQNVVLNFNYSKITSYIEAISSDENFGLVYGSARKEAGDSIQLTALPVNGYELDTWEILTAGASIPTLDTTDKKPTFIVPNQDTVIRANFVVAEYTATVIGIDGIADVSGDGVKSYDEEVTVSLTNIAPGTEFLHWIYQADGEPAAILNDSSNFPSFSFRMPPRDITLTLVADAPSYNLTATISSAQLIFGQKTSQTLEWNANQDLSDIYIGDTIYLSAFSDSGLNVEFASSDPLIGAITDRNKLTILGVGDFDITASQPGNSKFLPADSLTQSITAQDRDSDGDGVMDSIDPHPYQQPQVITFDAISDLNLALSEYQLQASSSSGLPVTYSITSGSGTIIDFKEIDTGVFSGDTIMLLSEGQFTIEASQDGNENFLPAENISITANVTAAVQYSQSIFDFTLDSSYYVSGGDVQLAAYSYSTSTSSNTGLPITYSTSDPSIIEIDGDKMLLKNSGSVEITASQDGTSLYLPVSQTRPTSVISDIDDLDGDGFLDYLQEAQTIGLSLPTPIELSSSYIELPRLTSLSYEVLYQTDDIRTSEANSLDTLSLNSAGYTKVTGSGSARDNAKAIEESQVIKIEHNTDWRKLDNPSQEYDYTYLGQITKHIYADKATSFDLSEDGLLIAIGNSSKNKVYIYDRSTGEYVQRGPALSCFDFDPDDVEFEWANYAARDSDEFGHSVSISADGSGLLVGAPGGGYCVYYKWDGGAYFVSAFLHTDQHLGVIGLSRSAPNDSFSLVSDASPMDNFNNASHKTASKMLTPPPSAFDNGITVSDFSDNFIVTSEGKLAGYGNNTWGTIDADKYQRNTESEIGTLQPISYIDGTGTEILDNISKVSYIGRFSKDNISSFDNSFEHPSFNLVIIKNDGSLWGSGSNYFGEISSRYNSTFSTGSNTWTYNANFFWHKIEAQNVSDAVIVDGNLYYLKDDNTLWGRGSNLYSQLGTNGGEAQWSSDSIKIADDVISFAAGQGVLFYITSDNTLFGLGDDSSGKIAGLTGLLNNHSPIEIDSSNNNNQSVFTSSDGRHLFIIKTDGSLWCKTTRSTSLGGTFRYSYRFEKLVNNSGLAVSKVSATGNALYLIKSDDSLWSLGWPTNPTEKSQQGDYRSIYYNDAEGNLVADREVFVMNDALNAELHQTASNNTHYYGQVLKTDQSLHGIGESSFGVSESSAYFKSYQKIYPHFSRVTAGRFGHQVYICPDNKIVISEPDYSVPSAVRCGRITTYGLNSGDVSAVYGSTLNFQQISIDASGNKIFQPVSETRLGLFDSQVSRDGVFMSCSANPSPDIFNFKDRSDFSQWPTEGSTEIYIWDSVNNSWSLGIAPIKRAKTAFAPESKNYIWNSQLGEASLISNEYDPGTKTSMVWEYQMQDSFKSPIKIGTYTDLNQNKQDLYQVYNIATKIPFGQDSADHTSVAGWGEVDRAFNDYSDSKITKYISYLDSNGDFKIINSPDYGNLKNGVNQTNLYDKSFYSINYQDSIHAGYNAKLEFVDDKQVYNNDLINTSFTEDFNIIKHSSSDGKTVAMLQGQAINTIGEYNYNNKNDSYIFNAVNVFNNKHSSACFFTDTKGQVLPVLNPSSSALSESMQSGYVLGSERSTNQGELFDPFSNSLEISVGGSHIVIIDSIGDVYQLGSSLKRNFLSDSPVLSQFGTHEPVKINGLSNIVASASGSNHSIFLDDNGAVYFYGNQFPGYSRRKFNITIDGSLALQGDDLEGVVNGSSIVVEEGDTIIINNTANFTTSPDDDIYISNDSFGSPISEYSVEGVLQKTLSSSGRYYIYSRDGVNSDGTANLSTVSNANIFITVTVKSRTENTLVQIANLPTITAITASGSQNYYLDINGNVWADGFNDFGQLGDGTNLDRRDPVQVLESGSVEGGDAIALSSIIDISSGIKHAAFLSNDKTVYSVGSNEHGQLGDGTNESRNYPVKVLSSGTESAGNAIDVANINIIDCGGNHTVLINTEGTVFSFGRNNQNQLGYTTTGTYHPYAKQVDGIFGLQAHAFTSLHAGFESTLLKDQEGFIFGVGFLPDIKYGPTSTITPIRATKLSIGLWPYEVGNLGYKPEGNLLVVDLSTTTSAVAALNISIDASMTNGSIEPNSPSASKGDTVSLTPVPENGYAIETITVTGDISTASFSPTLLNNGNFIFSMPGEDVTISASFSSLPSYNIIIDPDIVNGSLVSDPSNSAFQNNSITLTPTPNQTYSFEGITVTNSNNETVNTVANQDGSYSLTMPADNITATASFSLVTYDITLIGGIVGGSVIPDKYSAAELSTVTLTINTQNGYAFSSATITDTSGNNISYTDNSDGTLTFDMPASDISINAEFIQLNSYSISLGSITGGSVSTVPSGSANETQEVQLTLQPNPGYQLSSLTVIDSLSNEITLNSISGLEYTFIMPSADVTINALFSFIPVTSDISINNPMTNGDAQLSGSLSDYSGTATNGDTITFTVTPNNEYEESVVVSLDSDGTDIATSNTGAGYSFTMPVGNVTIDVSFTIITYDVTINSGITGGSVSSNKTSASKDELVTLTVIPDSDKILDTLTVIDSSGSEVTLTDKGDGTQEFSMPSDNVTVNATFINEPASADISSGKDHSMFLKSDSTVLACGRNDNGQLGDGTTTNQSNPVQVKNTDGSSFSDVVGISAGRNHSLFLKNDNTVWACGSDAFSGQLGDGTSTDRGNPVQVLNCAGGELSGVVGISAGGRHSVFLKSDGTVWACGYDGLGALGNLGGNTFCPEQVLLSGNPIQDVATISASPGNTLYLKTDGTVYGVGQNYRGQLSGPLPSNYLGIQEDVQPIEIGTTHLNLS